MSWMPGEDLLKRLWETLEKTGSGLASPWQIRREGKARADVRRHEMLVEAETLAAIEAWRRGEAVIRKDAAGLLSVEKKQPRLLAPPETENGRPQLIGDSSHTQSLPLGDVANFVVHSRARADVVSAEMTINLRAAIREAEEIAAEAAAANQPISNAPPPSDDWINAWREGAERVSDEQLRKIWARIVVNEVSSPGTFSLRTLTFIRTLNHSDAQRIQFISQFADGRTIYNTPKFFEEIELDFEKLLHLEEIGILVGVSGAGGLQIHFELPDNGSLQISFGGRATARFFNEKKMNVEIGCYKLTAIGFEMMSLCTKSPVPQKYFNELVAIIEATGLKQIPIIEGKAG